jgi:hypothetical protein
MTQFPGITAKAQVPSPLQASAVQSSPSLHVYAVPLHTLAPSQASSFVQALPSSQAVSDDFGVQAVLLVAGVHCSHWLAGLVVALA